MLLFVFLSIWLFFSFTFLLFFCFYLLAFSILFVKAKIPRISLYFFAFFLLILPHKQRYFSFFFISLSILSGFFKKRQRYFDLSFISLLFPNLNFFLQKQESPYLLFQGTSSSDALKLNTGFMTSMISTESRITSMISSNAL